MRVFEVRHDVEGGEAESPVVVMQTGHRRIVDRPGEFDRLVIGETEHFADGGTDHACRGADGDAPGAPLATDEFAQSVADARAELAPALAARGVQPTVDPSEARRFEFALEGSRIEASAHQHFGRDVLQLTRLGGVTQQAIGVVFVELCERRHRAACRCGKNFGRMALAAQAPGVDGIQSFVDGLPMISQPFDLLHAGLREAVVIFAAERGLSVPNEVERAHRGDSSTNRMRSRQQGA